MNWESKRIQPLDFFELLQWGESRYAHFSGYNSNGHEDAYGKYQWICAFGNREPFVFDEGESWQKMDALSQDNWLFGVLSYDLKNHIEDLTSVPRNYLDWPKMQWFEPEFVITHQRNGEYWVHFRGKEPEVKTREFSMVSWSPFQLTPLWSQGDYIEKANILLRHIQRGDIYEVNLCQPFEAEGVPLNGLSVFKKLNDKAQSSFASYFSSNGRVVIGASPERYLAKRGEKLISQPIKGTAKRYSDATLDSQSASDLLASEKERAENVMIVDMVRNDLSITAQKSSVEVEELFGIYSFNTVHQMISTITSKVKSGVSWSEIIQSTFPMGSMTGAPKVSAMKCIDEVETTQRGWYSGSVGYIEPSGDFDLNVVIRSLLYDEDSQKVQAHVGSALTILANAEDEYHECLLKVDALQKTLGDQ